ncbi:hypothetical protein [Clostridium sp. DL1XJH146]
MKMKKIILITITFSIVALFIFHCKGSKNRTNDIEIIPNRALTQKELEEFASNQNVKLIESTNFFKEFTVAIYKEDIDNKGFYRLSIDKAGDIYYDTIPSNRSDGSLPFSITTVHIENPFKVIIFFDEDILDKAYKINLKFKEEFYISEFIEDKEGLIIYDKNGKNEEVIKNTPQYIEILDKDKNAIYIHEFK